MKDERRTMNRPTYIAWIPGVQTKAFGSYEEAWRHAEKVHQATGRVALIEKIAN